MGSELQVLWTIWRRYWIIAHKPGEWTISKLKTLEDGKESPNAFVSEFASSI